MSGFSNVSSISITYELQIKRKSEGEEGPRKRGGNRMKKTKQESSDEEDDCAAINCLRPSGKDELLIIYLQNMALMQFCLPNIIRRLI